jgi:glycosyltransferase involved in cell wall biosynthesis
MLYASDKKNPALRLLDMLNTIWLNRKDIGAVLIDTYSSSAFYYAWASAGLCSRLKINYIPILRGGNLPERMAKSPGLSASVFGKSFTNVVISGYLQKSVEEHKFGYTLIPNNINLALYPFRHRTAATPSLLWVRAFHSVYNPQLAIKVVKRLSDSFPGITLTMVGPDKDGSMDQCKKLAAELAISEKVTFTGKLSKEAWRAMAAQHDIFFSTTNFDNMPISVLEALALGMPVVSTDVGGVPYLISNEQNGLLVKPDDVDEMAAAISRYINDSSFTATISKNARATAELYDWKTIRLKWHELLQPLVTGK